MKWFYTLKGSKSDVFQNCLFRVILYFISVFKAKNGICMLVRKKTQTMNRFVRIKHDVIESYKNGFLNNL